MKKILIGTHNQGKFREISYLTSKKFKKISPISLKIPSPKETGLTFLANSKLKANFFCNDHSGFDKSYRQTPISSNRRSKLGA